MKRGWFGPKKLGWGASPASWQGWLTTALFIAAMVAVAIVHPQDDSLRWIVHAAVVVAYLAIVLLTYRSDARTLF